MQLIKLLILDCTVLTIVSYGTFPLVYVHTNSSGVALQEQKAKTCPTTDGK